MPKALDYLDERGRSIDDIRELLLLYVYAYAREGFHMNIKNPSCYHVCARDVIENTDIHSDLPCAICGLLERHREKNSFSSTYYIKQISTVACLQCIDAITTLLIFRTDEYFNYDVKCVDRGLLSRAP
jgi:hypothetical protein